VAAERRPFELGTLRFSSRSWQPLQNGTFLHSRRENAFERAASRRRVFRASFPTLLDDYVLQDFFVYLGMIMAAFLVLVLVFTLFELLGDILRNQTPLSSLQSTFSTLLPICFMAWPLW